MAETNNQSLEILILRYLTQKSTLISLIQPLLESRAKNVKNFVGVWGMRRQDYFLLMFTYL